MAQDINNIKNKETTRKTNIEKTKPFNKHLDNKAMDTQQLEMHNKCQVREKSTNQLWFDHIHKKAVIPPMHGHIQKKAVIPPA